MTIDEIHDISLSLLNDGDHNQSIEENEPGRLRAKFNLLGGLGKVHLR